MLLKGEITGAETVEKLPDGTYKVNSVDTAVMPLGSIDNMIGELDSKIAELTARKNNLEALKQKFLSAKIKAIE